MIVFFYVVKLKAIMVFVIRLEGFIEVLLILLLYRGLRSNHFSLEDFLLFN